MPRDRIFDPNPNGAGKIIVPAALAALADDLRDVAQGYYRMFNPQDTLRGTLEIEWLDGKTYKIDMVMRPHSD
jgi:hypothetical protein